MMAILRYGLFLSLMLVAAVSHAGSRQGAVNPQFDQQQLMDFSKLVERTAAQHGARVFLLGRVGRSSAEMPEGITYTHTALAVYSMITTEDGKKAPGYAIYNLYQKYQDLAHSELVVDYPADFFAGASELKAGIAIPTIALQKRLLAIIHSGEFRTLHNPDYSIVANPYNSQLQNCTEFTLDVINAAIYQTTDIKQLKANSKAYFMAQKINQSGLKLKVAAMFMDDLSLDDHTSAVKTATFTTLVNYLRDNDLLQHQQVLNAQSSLKTL